jgi:hypothetical protein
MGLSSRDLDPAEPPFSYLGQWHANLLYINRRKCVLFVNDKTLLNFVVLDLDRSQLRELPDQFRGYLSCILYDENLGKSAIQRILGEYDEIQIGKTNNRSVVGSMNDIAYCYKYEILEAGGVHSWRVPEIIKGLNRMPMKAIGFQFPIDKLRALYAAAT